MKLHLNHQNVYFTSDAHFFHANIIKYDKRPFKDVYEMNDTIVENWNNKVSKDDIVFYLGDLSFEASGRRTNELVHDLNGTIHFIMGNHDHIRDIKALSRFETINDYVELSVPDEDANRGKQQIMMMHYAMLSWDKAHHGAWALHGHEHGHLMKNPAYDWYYKYKVLDVGSNMHNYTPLSYAELKEHMKTKQTMLIHH
jgi:calcineurin-like phosphoesterase family protein